MDNSAPRVLLLMPAYNEEQRIESTLRDYAGYFRQSYNGRFRVVVVLNGCRDNTLGVVERVRGEFPEVEAINFPAAIGKGGALIEGLRLASQADLIGYVDADGATPPREFHRLIGLAGQGDCIVGSRWLPGAVLHPAQTRLRKIVSRCFYLLVQSLFWLNIRDTQCACKLMRREAVQAVHGDLCIADLAFDVNLLVAIKRGGFRILETPTEWTDKPGSKVSPILLRSSLVMFLSVVRLRVTYSPFRRLLRPLRPLEGWVYRGLFRAPPPRSLGEKPAVPGTKDPS